MFHLFILIIFLLGSNFIIGMEEQILSYTNDLDIFICSGNDMQFKIFASLDLKDKNAFRRTCKYYKNYFSKQNSLKKLSLFYPCILSLKDQVFGIRDYAIQEDEACVMNLIKNVPGNRILQIITLFYPAEYKDKSEKMRTQREENEIEQKVDHYLTNQTEENLKVLMPHVMNVYKGDEDTWGNYIFQNYYQIPFIDAVKDYYLFINCSEEKRKRKKEDKIKILYFLQPNKEGTIIQQILKITSLDSKGIWKNIVDAISNIVNKKEDLMSSGLDNDGNSLLHLAMSRCKSYVCDKDLTYDLHVKLIEMFASSTCINMINRNVLTPLQLAIKDDDSSIHRAQLLVEKGAYPNVQNTNGNTILHLACLRGNVDFSKELIEKKNANPNIQNKIGLTPLLMVIKEYVKECGDRIFDNQYCSELYRIIELLIQNKTTDLDMQDVDGNTAFHCAVEQIGHKLSVNKLIELLIKYEANPNILNNAGKAPIHMLVAQENNYGIEQVSKILKMLLDYHKTNLKICDGDGNCILHLIIDYKYLQDEDRKDEDHKDLIKNMLYVNFELLNIQNKRGYTPLHMAAVKNVSHVAYLLLEKKADQAIQSFDDMNTPLHTVIKEKKLKHMIMPFAKGNPALTCKDKDGNAVIHLVVQDKDYSVLEALIVDSEKRMDCTLQNDRGNTPLHDAVVGKDLYETVWVGKTKHFENKLVAMGDLLIKKFPSMINVQNEEKKTALDIAIENRNWRIIDLLCANDASFFDAFKKSIFNLSFHTFIKNVIIASLKKWGVNIILTTGLFYVLYYFL